MENPTRSRKSVKKTIFNGAFIVEGDFSGYKNFYLVNIIYHFFKVEVV